MFLKLLETLTDLLLLLLPDVFVEHVLAPHFGKSVQGLHIFAQLQGDEVRQSEEGLVVLLRHELVLLQGRRL